MKQPYEQKSKLYMPLNKSIKFNILDKKNKFTQEDEIFLKKDLIILTELNEKIVDVLDYIYKRENINKSIFEVNEEYKSMDKSFKRLKKEYDIILDFYKKEQAYFLAKDLKAGEACPVCGSNNHPQKAEMINNKDINVTDEIIKIKKEKLFIKETKLISLLNYCTELKKEKLLIDNKINRKLSILGYDVNIDTLDIDVHIEKLYENIKIQIIEIKEVISDLKI